MLRYFPQIWTSDNTDADERTIIQHGTSIVYPVSTISCHVSKYPSMKCARPISMKTRGDIAQMGPTGYELDTTVMSKEDYAEIKPQIEEYRRCEELVLSGDLYRIENPIKTNPTACGTNRSCRAFLLLGRCARFNPLRRRVG